MKKVMDELGKMGMGDGGGGRWMKGEGKVLKKDDGERMEGDG